MFILFMCFLTCTPGSPPILPGAVALQASMVGRSAAQLSSTAHPRASSSAEGRLAGDLGSWNNSDSDIISLAWMASEYSEAYRKYWCNSMAAPKKWANCGLLRYYCLES